MNRKFTKKHALILSLCLLLLWGILGTGATLAWFTDVSPVTRNSFLVGLLDLTVSYKNDLMNDYEIMGSDSAVFNDQALYEPNYTQVVRLKVENTGSMAFNYKLSVQDYDYTDSINVYGTNLHLPDYLKFGVLYSDQEAQLERDVAQALATEDKTSVIQNFQKLNNYFKEDEVTVEPGQTRYVAVIIYMPREVGNEANYRKGETPPQVQLGLTVYAQQAGTPMK